LSNSARTDVNIENIYFDSADRLLQRHRMALRVRQIDGRWVQTLKTSSESRVVGRRGEWETPARLVRGRGTIDLAQLSESPLPQLLAKQDGSVKLKPVFRTQVQRSQWTVEHGDAQIEVALDVGEIMTVSEDAMRREPICEVELELKQPQHDGAAKALIDLALQLLDAHGKAPLGLTPVSRSKAERGYQLLSQRPPPAVKASANGFIADTTKKSTTASVLRTVIAHGVSVLTANIELILRYDDPEYVHQARVALRRVRSAIRLFDRDKKDVPHTLIDELRWFAGALGNARDWDVITDETLPSLGKAMGVDAIKLIVAKAGGKRRQARATVRKAARSSRYAALVLDAERWSMSPVPGVSELIVDAAAPALKDASKKLFERACFFAALSRPRQHRVRILAKRLRYALDLFAVVLPKYVTARYIESLAELQDTLGQLNDAAVAKAVLPRLSKSTQLKRSAALRFDSIEPDRVHDAERRLLKLSSSKKPWQ
ncbi:MAG TPA: CHAD domain-containing protein, partial [Burkholderiaceae bacterium]|nr:CHAD domain-containing protein [Burkholderiaceae bacterium]